MDRTVDTAAVNNNLPKQVVRPPLSPLPVIKKSPTIGKIEPKISTDNSQPRPKQTVRPRPSELVNPAFSKKGYALILNHYEFTNGNSKREGTQNDVNALKNVFALYNVETEVENDLTLCEIERKVDNLKLRDFSKYECFIIVILTHGSKNDSLSAADRAYNFSEVIENPLLIENASLLNKPKIFIKESCRGDARTDSEPSQEMLDHQKKTIYKKNIFCCNATYEGYVAFGYSNYGTVFIQIFCDMLTKFGADENIYDVMMKVNVGLSYEDLPQVSTVMSSMHEPFCFGSLLEDY